MRLCVELGGCLTGEHGVGIEKRELMATQFTATDLDVQMRIKSVFDPAMAAEPGQSLSARRQREPARRARRTCTRGGVTHGAIVTELLRPAAEWELQSMIAKLASQKRRHGGRRPRRVAQCRPRSKADVVLSTSGLKGVTLYEPTEIVMSARAGTPVYEIEAILAARGQMLAFEPVDLGPATGAPGGALSIGGVFATNFSGSQTHRGGKRAG